MNSVVAHDLLTNYKHHLKQLPFTLHINTLIQYKFLNTTLDDFALGIYLYLYYPDIKDIWPDIPDKLYIIVTSIMKQFPEIKEYFKVLSIHDDQFKLMFYTLISILADVSNMWVTFDVERFNQVVATLQHLNDKKAKGQLREVELYQTLQKELESVNILRKNKYMPFNNKLFFADPQTIKEIIFFKFRKITSTILLSIKEFMPNYNCNNINNIINFWTKNKEDPLDHLSYAFLILKYIKELNLPIVKDVPKYPIYINSINANALLMLEHPYRAIPYLFIILAILSTYFPNITTLYLKLENKDNIVFNIPDWLNTIKYHNISTPFYYIQNTISPHASIYIAHYHNTNFKYTVNTSMLIKSNNIYESIYKFATKLHQLLTATI